MKEQLIDFETAKLAKEKGFDIEVPPAYYYLYSNGTTQFYENNNVNDTYISDKYHAAVVAQYLLQKWLRDKFLHNFRDLIEQAKPLL